MWLNFSIPIFVTFCVNFSWTLLGRHHFKLLLILRSSLFLSSSLVLISYKQLSFYTTSQLSSQFLFIIFFTSKVRPRSFETMVSVLFDRGEGGGAGNYKYKCKKFINAKTGRKNQIWLRTCSFSFIYNYHTQSRVSHSLFPLRRGTLSGMWGVPCDL